MEKQRPRYWTYAMIYWRGGTSHVLTSWFTRPACPFSHLEVLHLSQAELEVRHLSVLQHIKKLTFNKCTLITGRFDDPWPLLSSGSRSLTSVDLSDCTLEIPDAFLETSAPYLEVSAQPFPLSHLLVPVMLAASSFMFVLRDVPPFSSRVSPLYWKSGVWLLTLLLQFHFRC